MEIILLATKASVLLVDVFVYNLPFVSNIKSCDKVILSKNIWPDVVSKTFVVETAEIYNAHFRLLNNGI